MIKKKINSIMIIAIVFSCKIFVSTFSVKADDSET